MFFEKIFVYRVTDTPFPVSLWLKAFTIRKEKTMDDSDIIGLYFSRDERAISETAGKYGRLCKSIASNILKNDSDAEECLSDACLAAWRAIPPARPDDLCAYIARITRNLALNRLRSSKRKCRGGGTDTALNDDILPAESLDTLIESRRAAEVINLYLYGISAEKRKVFVMRYFFCDPVNDIADCLGMSVGQVKMSLFRTRKELKKLLEKEEIEI